MQDLPDAPEPGSPTVARMVGLLVVLLILGVAVLQQVAVYAPPPAPAAPADLRPPDTQFELSAKITTKVFHAIDGDPALAAAMGGDPARDLRDLAQTPEDRLRLALTLGEIDTPEAGLEELERLEADLAEASPLRPDVTLVRSILEGGTPTEEEAAWLESRHGWFGRLGTILWLEDADPRREAVVGRGAALVALLLAFFGGAAAALLAGFVLLVVALVKLSSGTLRMHLVPRAPGGSVLIETVAVFIIAFLLLKAVTALVGGMVTPEAAVGVGLGAQWLLLLAVLWPVLRGMPLRRTLYDLGFHRGRGYLREVGAGIVGYLACLPILLVGVISIIVLALLQQMVRVLVGGKPTGPTHNAVLDIMADPPAAWMVVLLFLLATVWAPLAEEAIFRGALYGHLRRRRRMLVSAMLVAPAFGLMHGYPILLLGGVISLGFGFSLLREWRGSLIAPITAHFINNATILTFFALLLRLVG